MAIGIISESLTATLVAVPRGLDIDDEPQLVSQAKNGSADAIERLVERFERRVFRLARRITNNYEDAEDVMQTAFVKAFQNLDSFRGECRFYSWLARIAVNEALMKVRRRRYKEVSIDHEGEEEDILVRHELQDWGPTPEDRYSQQELRKILDTTIRELNPGYRVVFQLRDVEGLSTEETAQTLDLSLSAVKTRLRRARLQLRDSLDIYFRPMRGSENHLPARYSQATRQTYT